MSVPISAAAQHAVEPGALHVQDLALQRQDGLAACGPCPAWRTAAGAVALDDEHFRLCRVTLLAVGQLARQRAHVQHALAPGELPRPARRLARAGGVHHLLHDGFGLARVRLEPMADHVGNDTACTTGCTSELTSLSLVWLLNFGSGTLTDSTQVMPSRMSSPTSAKLLLAHALGVFR